MKKFLLKGLIILQFVCLFLLNGYSQSSNQSAILGKIKIDEKGQVTVQSMEGLANVPVRGFGQTSRMPEKFNNIQERSKTDVKTESSGLNTVLNDYAYAKTSSRITDGARSFSSREADLHQYNDPEMTENRGNKGEMTIASQEVKAADIMDPEFNGPGQEKQFSSSDPIPDYKGSFRDNESAKGTEAGPNLTLKSGTSSINISGTTINISVTITNNGTSLAALSELGYYLSPDISFTTTPNYPIGTDAVEALEAGGTSAETHSVDVSALSIPCGTYYVFFNIDNKNQVTESSETDNAWYFTSPTVTVPCVANLDLASGTSSLNVTETNVSVSLTVINNGSTLAAASVLGYYLSSDVSLTTTPNYLIGTDAVGTLAVGGTSAESITVNVAAISVPCGTYYVIFKIDHTDQVTESNENDNVWYWSTPKVTIPCVPNLDLASGSASLNVTGTNVNIAVTAINNGSTSAAASTLGYYLSPDVSLTTTPNYLIGTDAVGALAVGATSAESITIDVLPIVPCGTYYVIFKFDYTDQVTESSETDNIWYFSSPTVTVPCLPNLDLSSGTASLNVTGTSVSVALTVTNNGSESAAASELGYYLSPDVTLTTTPNYLFGTDAVGALAVSATSAESITVDVATSSIPCGTYYVIFKIDNLDQITESNESDNVFYWSTPTVTIPCVPNLDLASGSASLNVTGTNVNIAVTAINNGSTSAAASVLGYYLSADANLTTEPNYLIGTDAVDALAVGATSAENITVDVAYSSVPCGTYYVLFKFDHTNLVTESNENDNFWYFSSPKVTIPCVPNLDLKSGTSSINITGTNVTVGVTVINNGSTAAAASELGYYLSPDISITTTPNYLIGTDPVSALGVGGTSAESLAVDVTTILPLIPAGSYYVFFVFDHLNAITEINEIDNAWYFTSPKVTIPSTTGLNEIFKSEDDLRIYPNPTGGKVLISSANLPLEGSKVTVVNSLGNVIFERITDSDQYEIDLSGYSGGLYYIKIEGKSWSYTGKVVLNK